MSTNLLGWVEVNEINKSDEDYWFRVIELDVIVEQSYDVFGALFGVRVKPGIEPVAKDLGFPAGSDKKHAKEFEHESIVGVTWANYGEISSALDQLCENEFMEGWRVVRKAMSSLSEIYGNNNVRVVVAFDNYG